MEGGQIKGTFRWLRFVASRFLLTAQLIGSAARRGVRPAGPVEDMPRGPASPVQSKLALPQYHQHWQLVRPWALVPGSVSAGTNMPI